MNTKEKIIGIHAYVFNKKDNGGEALTLKTTFYSNEYSEVYSRQELSLNSYCNTATFHLNSEITPTKLRELAHQLEDKLIDVTNKIKDTDYSHEKLVGSNWINPALKDMHKICFAETVGAYLLVNTATGYASSDYSFSNFDDLVEELKKNWNKWS